MSLYAGRPSMMSRHEGVSCDSCMKSNFSNLRYKCLVCYDYDLCATCHDSGATSSRHTVNHPMQCILTRADSNIFYGGDSSSSLQTQSYTCSYCGQMGFTVALLYEHIRTTHGIGPGTVATEVLCPVCAAHPSGDPNHVTDDLGSHISLVHRTASTDFDEDQLTSIRHIRRLTHPTQMTNSSSNNTGNGGNGVNGSSTGGSGSAGSSGASRTSRSAMMQLIEPPSMPGPGMSAGGREPMDPIAELLSQLSSVRSRALGGPHSLSSHFHQLEMQLSSSSVFNSFRQHLERLPARQSDQTARTAPVSAAASNAQPVRSATADSQLASAGKVASASSGSGNSATRSRFLLSRCGEKNLSELEKANYEAEAADKSLFLQELLLSSMTDSGRVMMTSDSPLAGSLLLDDVVASDSDTTTPQSSASLQVDSENGSTNSLTGISDDLDSSAADRKPTDLCLHSTRGLFCASEHRESDVLSNACDDSLDSIHNASMQ